jgi:hypothetical protein
MRVRVLAGRTPARLGHDLAAGKAQRVGTQCRVVRVDGHFWEQAVEP